MSKIEFEGMIPDTSTGCTLLGICPRVKFEGLVSEKEKFAMLSALAGVRLKVTVEVYDDQSDNQKADSGEEKQKRRWPSDETDA